MKTPWLAALALALPAAALAQDRADIERTQIIGNKELPKVLYIVPWKKPMPGEASGRPRTSLLDEVLAPIDRTEFRRGLAYRQQIATDPNPSPVAPSGRASKE